MVFKIEEEGEELKSPVIYLVFESLMSKKCVTYTQFEKPEKVMYNTYSDNTKTYIFAKKAISVIADPESDLVFQAIYFKPMSLEDYLARWGESLLEENPYWK